MIKWLKNVSMFLTAPFIGLAYLFALPIYGLYYMFVTGVEARKKNNQPST